MKADIAYNRFRNKVHIINDETDIPYCGNNPLMLSVSDTVDVGFFINQADPDESRCKSCEKIFAKILNESE